AAGSRVAAGPACVPKGPLLSPDAVTWQSLPRPPSSRRPGGPPPSPPPATMSTSSLRRQMKNIVHNYSEAEIKVREATSNDPWGPSSSLMSEIADLTYNQCKENMYAVQTLKDFQYVDRDGKDQGVNVREKAKQLVALLRDEDRLREERAHALKTKEKLAQTATAVGSGPPPEAEQAWPQSSGEEELQLQLALAMSKEEADQVRPGRGDAGHGGVDFRSAIHLHASPSAPARPSSPGGAPVGGPPASDPWAPAPAFSDPWGASHTKPSANGTAGTGGVARGCRASSVGGVASPGPLGKLRAHPDPTAVGGFDTEPDEFSDFERLRTALPASGSSTGELELLAGEVPARSPGAFDMSGVGGSLAEAVGSPPPAAAPTPTPPTRKTPESFLGPNAALVDLDSLVSRPGPTPPGAKASNPFLPSGECGPGAGVLARPADP
ncbi:hypothetical protein E2I00_013968, partial [Balaenoptera physalus]